jgi:MFS transporter, MHS family, proline/betaine transporter
MLTTGSHTWSLTRNLSALGTTLEWYDFALYLYLAPVLAGLFCPSHDSLAALLATFAVFAVSYFMRPVGALFFGQLGDRLGRKTALITFATPASASATTSRRRSSPERRRCSRPR